MRIRLFFLAAMTVAVSFCSSCGTVQRVVTADNLVRAWDIYENSREIVESAREPVVMPDK